MADSYYDPGGIYGSWKKLLEWSEDLRTKLL